MFCLYLSNTSENELIKIPQTWVGAYASSFQFYFLLHLGRRRMKQEGEEED